MKRKKDWKDYPIGTKAYALGGGHWTKTQKGWEWFNGDVYPSPGGDVINIEKPAAQKTPMDGRGQEKNDGRIARRRT